ncbi:ABC transporter substrate-binding protein [Streptomyces californicus]
MNTPPSPSGAEHTGGSPIRLGAPVPLTRPGWAEAGRHLLAGLDLAVREVNDAGGIDGRPLELVVRDTAADPERAAAAVDELADLGVAAVVGEYHSVVARAAAARADALGVPFLCSSAVLDALTEEPTEWVARLAPAQSHGWRIYADFLLGAGRRRIAVATQPSVYWTSGTRVLRHAPRPPRRHRPRTRRVAHARGPVRRARRPWRDGAPPAGRPPGAGGAGRPGRPERPAARGDPHRSAGRTTGVRRMGRGAGRGRRRGPVPRYPPERLGPLGERVGKELRERLGEAPSFVAFEGWDTVAVLAAVLRSHGTDRAAVAASWPRVAVEGTRGPIRFRTPGIGVWQWVWAPAQVVDRDPAEPDRLRLLHAG